jgi:hypothetical protein
MLAEVAVFNSCGIMARSGAEPSMSGNRQSSLMRARVRLSPPTRKEELRREVIE